MATGPKAQFARIVCQLCEKENDVEWKCLQCEEIMCNDCKITHLKMKISRDHTVTTLRELMQASGPEVKETNVSSDHCPTHKTELIIMYCKECNTPVCIDCLSTNHNKHNVVKISAVLEEKGRELSEITSLAKNMVSKLKDGCISISENSKTYSKETKDAVVSVKQQGEALKHAVDKVVQEFINTLEREEKKMQVQMTSRKNSFEEKVNEVEQHVADCEDKLKSKNIMSIITTTGTTRQKLDDYKSLVLPSVPQPVKFVPGSIDDIQLKKIIGRLEQIQSTKSPSIAIGGPKAEPIRKAEVTKSFQSRVGLVSRIAVVDNTHVWVGCGGETEVALISIDGKVKQTVKLNFDIHNISVTSTGDLLLTTYSDHYIKKMIQGGQCVDIADTSPFYTRGLHVKKDNDILVCLYDINSKQGKVTRMSVTGQIKQQIQYDQHNKSLFVDPCFVGENINEDVCVIDYTDTRVSVTTLVVVNKDGHLRFRYTGPTDVKIKEKIECWDVKCDISGCILLSDYNNKQIHQLDIDGRFIRFILKSEDGLEGPAGICLDGDRKLWISNYDGKKSKIMVAQVE